MAKLKFPKKKSGTPAMSAFDLSGLTDSTTIKFLPDEANLKGEHWYSTEKLSKLKDVVQASLPAADYAAIEQHVMATMLDHAESFIHDSVVVETSAKDTLQAIHDALPGGASIDYAATKSMVMSKPAKAEKVALFSKHYGMGDMTPKTDAKPDDQKLADTFLQALDIDPDELRVSLSHLTGQTFEFSVEADDTGLHVLSLDADVLITFEVSTMTKAMYGMLSTGEKSKFTAEIAEGLEDTFGDLFKPFYNDPTPALTLLEGCKVQTLGEAETQPEPEAPVEQEEEPDVAPTSTLKALLAGKAAAQPKPASLIDTVYPPSKIATGERVKLVAADKLYQPVFGSSSTSRYVTVLVGKDGNVAARYMDGSLSIRFEGPDIKSKKEELKALGFDTISDAYASIHLECDKPMARKALGAILFGMQLNANTPLPNMAHIIL